MIPRFHLIEQYINPNTAARSVEFDECFRRNLAHPLVATLHNLCEPGTVVPDEFRCHPKYREHRVERWLTFQDAFDHANAYLTGEFVGICNLDIFFDVDKSDWEAAFRLVEKSFAICMSRTEFNGDGTTFKDSGLERTAFANSQDAWLFKAPIDVPNCDFEIGTLGCDNALAHRFKLAGRQPFNAPNRFKIYHFDRCRGKTSANQGAVHAAERKRLGLPTSRFPEKQGCYLVPDFDAMSSVDELLKQFKIGAMAKYGIICELLNRFATIDNSQ